MFHTTIRYSAHNCNSFDHTQFHTRRTELLLTLVRFVWPFYIRTSSVCRTFSKQKVHGLAFSRTLLRKLVYVPHAYCCSFIWKVFDVFVCAYLCTVYTLTLTAFAFSIAFILYTILYYTILYYTILYYTILYYTILDRFGTIWKI